tara:strand:- start:1941 stop:2321 length:381 start_codon:yes stop_codon:yes gene_type:complete
MNKLLIKLLIILHILFFVSWIVLFFIPLSLWENRITYQFHYVYGIIFLNLIWGGFMKFFNINSNTFICPLTTFTQYLRGYSFKDTRNNQHLFISEIFNKFNLKYSNITEKIGATLSLVIVSYLYLI